MERAVEIFVVIQLLIIGLSHIFQRRAWVGFMIWLRELGHTGVFLNGMLYLWFGSIIVAFHNVWTGLPVILTVFGYILLLRACVAFLVPSLSLRALQRVSTERQHEFIVPGIGFVVIAVVLAYSIWQG